MPNQFPLHLEKQSELIVRRLFDRIGKRLTTAVRRSIKRNLILVPETRVDVDPDQDIDLTRLLSDIDDEFSGDDIDALLGATVNRLSQNYALIDSWSHARITESIEGLNQTLATGAIPVVSVPRGFGQTETIIQSAAERQANLIRSIVEQHQEQVRQAVANSVQKGVTEGFSTDKVAETILRSVEKQSGVTTRQAEFWARDQMGTVFGQINKSRQTAAGITGYIWRTVQDSAVRDDHAALEGRFFTWDKGAPGLTAPGASHPGEDYNCRCFSEPALEENT